MLHNYKQSYRLRGVELVRRHGGRVEPPEVLEHVALEVENRAPVGVDQPAEFAGTVERWQTSLRGSGIGVYFLAAQELVLGRWSLLLLR